MTTTAVQPVRTLSRARVYAAVACFFIAGMGAGSALTSHSTRTVTVTGHVPACVVPRVVAS